MNDRLKEARSHAKWERMSQNEQVRSSRNTVNENLKLKRKKEQKERKDVESKRLRQMKREECLQSVVLDPNPMPNYLKNATQND